MKAPSFWYSKKNGPQFLSPLAKLYAAAGRRHRRQSTPQNISIPVICIGNIVSGGSGKTPTAIAIQNLLQNEKISLSPFFLTRGYRGKIEGPERVDNSHDSALWGDEALLLSRHAPTIVSKNRHAGGMMAQDLGADAVIMDDGMQNYSIVKDISFCVIDGATGFGNGCVVPQGPLRQPLEEGFTLTDAFILIGDDATDAAFRLPPSKPVFKANLKVSPSENLSREQIYMAFCGIGFPAKFKKSLDEAGLKLIDFISFDDHHAYTGKEIVNLIETARAKNARLITTEKDFARLPDYFQKNIVDVLPVEIIFEDPDSLSQFVKSKIKS